MTVTPLWLEIKRFVKVMWLWANDGTTSCWGVPNGNLQMRFTCFPNSMFLASPWLDKYIFSNLIVIFLTLSKLQLTLLFYFKWLWTGHSYFTDFGQKIPKSWGIKIWVPQLINRLQMFNLLFLSVPCFSD